MVCASLILCIVSFNMIELRIPTSEHPVLLTEAPFNPQANREKMAQIMFETFNVPGMFVEIPAILSYYYTGRQSSLIVHSGETVTNILPVYNGYVCRKSIIRVDIGGRTVNGMK